MRNNKKFLEFKQCLEKLIERDAGKKRKMETARRKFDYPCLATVIGVEVESHRDFVIALNASLKVYCDLYCLKFEPLKSKYHPDSSL